MECLFLYFVARAFLEVWFSRELFLVCEPYRAAMEAESRRIDEELERLDRDSEEGW